MSLKDYRTYGRPLAGSAIIFFLMNINRLFIGTHPEISLNILIWLSYSFILFIPKSCWTRKRFIVAACFIILETTAALVWFQEIKLVYFLIVLVLSASIRLSSSRWPFPAMAATIVTVMLYSKFGREDLFSLISFFLVSFVLYFNIRSRMQRNEMYDINKRHLAELQNAYNQLQEASVSVMQNAVLEERTRIARDIHDAVGHSLTSLIVQIQTLRYMIRKDPVQAEQSLETILVVARQGLHDIRSSVHALVDDRSRAGVASLKALLSRMEASASIRYTFQTDLNETEVEVEVDVYGILFSVLQEAITNIIRHSQATQVDVSLNSESGKIVMRIRDNGILASGQKLREGFGLKVMKTRLEERDGGLIYSILEPNGFEIKADLPTLDQDYKHEVEEG